MSSLPEVPETTNSSDIEIQDSDDGFEKWVGSGENNTIWPIVGLQLCFGLRLNKIGGFNKHTINKGIVR